MLLTLTHEGGAYHISLPSINPHDKLRLRELMNIQAYSPARIQDIHVVQHNGALMMHILVYDEAAPITTSQLDRILSGCARRQRGFLDSMSLLKSVHKVFQVLFFSTLPRNGRIM